MSAITISTNVYPVIGMMTMPEGFPYKEVFLHGRPKHDKYSHFRIRHPEMPCSKRAKLFAPFDALKWFHERIAAKEVVYEQKRQLSETKKEELDRKLSMLHRLTFNKKSAVKNRPLVTVTFYYPCSDEENDAYGSGGIYREITGIVTRVDPVIEKTVTINGQILAIEDLMEIKGDFSFPDCNSPAH